MAEILKNNKEWKISGKLSLTFCEEPQILMQLHHIKFPFLKEIDFACNNIESIEVLPKIYLPSLISINLGKNNKSLGCNLIISTKSLRKTRFPLLKRLLICKSPFLIKMQIILQILQKFQPWKLVKKWKFLCLKEIFGIVCLKTWDGLWN